jgi:hypothetical protein
MLVIAGFFDDPHFEGQCKAFQMLIAMRADIAWEIAAWRAKID